MEELLAKLATQAPSLGVLVFIVWFFLKHMTARDELIRDINRESLAARAESREAIRDNTEVMQNNTEALNELRITVERKIH